MIKKIICGLTLVLGSLIINAQEISGRVELDSSHIVIGNQFKMTLKLTLPKGVEFEWPLIIDTIKTSTSNISVIDKQNQDTVIQNNVVTVSQSYIVTAFNSGLYVVDSLLFIINNNGVIDSVYSSSATFRVSSVTVDTSKEFIDIKPIIEQPYVFDDFIPWIFIGIGFIVIAILIWFIIRRFSKKQEDPSFNGKMISKDPDYVVALRELERIYKEKIWQHGLYKEYYTEITDVLRDYMESRFNIDAKEMTSLEILDALNNKDVDRKLLQDLKTLFKNADMVKFAKAKPSVTDNDLSLKISKSFVETTKKEATSLLEDLENNIDEEFKENKN